MWHSLLAESARATPVARARLERRGVERRGSNSARPAEFRSRRRAREVVLASSGHREVSRSSADATSDPPAPHLRPRLVVPEAGRRAALVGASGALVSALGRACGCGGCAWAMAPLVDADPARSAFFDVRRDATRDALFAEGMNTGMTGYEMAIADRKRALFKRMLERLPRDEEGSGNVEATVVEVGMGTFPNADAYFNAFASFDCAIPAAALGSPILCDARRAALTDSAKTLPRLDIVGVDPNDAMEKYARAAFEAARAKGTANDEDAAKKKNTLRVARGVAEALPLPTSSADAVVCTLTLCSVLDPEAAVAEIRRVLKPGGSFVFVEHVLSDDAALRAQQLALDGLQAKLADGCHLNRQTLRTIQSAGFADFELVERFTLPGFGLISSQVAGIAVN
jgi:SAM-dependent methyltransferase